MTPEREIREAEEKFRRAIGKHSSCDILAWVHRATAGKLPPESAISKHYRQVGVPPFFWAGIADRAVRWSNPHRGRKGTMTLRDFEAVFRAAQLFLLADGRVLDDPEELDPVKRTARKWFIRTLSQQTPFMHGFFLEHARIQVVFEEIARGFEAEYPNHAIDFTAKFLDVFGVNVADYIQTHLSIWTMATTESFFTRADIEAGRLGGINLPPPEIMLKALDHLVGDADQIREIQEHTKARDRSFSMYDLNALMSYPVIRPYKGSANLPAQKDLMISPMPFLVVQQGPSQIYHRMRMAYGNEFTTWFGHIFQRYVDRIFRESQFRGEFFTEEQIRQHYPENRGPAPDQVLIEGDTAIICDCKATRWLLGAMTTGDESEIRKTLTKVADGLKQCASFARAARAGIKGLEAIQRCSEIVIVIVTWEPLWGFQSVESREYIGRLFPELETEVPYKWLSLPVDQLERSQPFVRHGASWAEILEQHFSHNDYDAIREIRKGFPEDFNSSRESFLAPVSDALFSRFGIPGWK